MILESLTIEDFKQFAKKITLDKLAPGLNVFTGKNEAGKSTIAEAVRTLFLQRNSAKLDGLVPWSKPSATPTIEARFTHAGKTYTLSKQFVSKGRCYLTRGSTKLDGDDAEKELRDLFGFSQSGRGVFKAENAGIPGLLWVQQGDSLRIVERAGPAADYLRSALGSLSGGAVVGGEDVLIKAVEAELCDVRTPNTRGQRGGKLPKLQRELEELKTQRAEWEQQQATFESDLAALAELQSLHDKDTKAKPWVELEARAEAARAKIAGVAAAKSRRDGLQQDLKVGQLTLSSLTDKAKAAEAAKASLAANREAMAAAEVDAATADAAYEAALAATTAAKGAHTRAVDAEALANAAATADECRGQLQFLTGEVARLKTAIDKAEQAKTSLEALVAERAKVELDPKSIEKLKTATKKLIQIRAQLEAASTRLEYRLNSPVGLDGKSLEGTGSLIVDTAKTLTLADQSELTIVPGSSNRQKLEDELATLEAEETRLLQTMGVASLDDAESKHKQWNTLDSQVRAQKDVVALFAPDGIDSIKTLLAEVSSKKEAAQSRLDALPPTENALPVATAAADKKSAAKQLEAADSAQNAAVQKRSVARAEVQRLQSSVKATAAEVESSAFVEALEKLSNEVFQQGNAVKQLKAALDDAEEQLAALTLVNPEAEVARLTDSARIAQEKYHARDRKIVDLRARIQTAGGSGVGENLALANARIELLERQEKDFLDKERAMALLLGMLLEERKEAIQQLQSPLTKRLEHYLRWLFPQSAMTLGDNLEPVSLTRTDRLDELGALSYGTQEQLGILTRLAYADLLQEAGRPTVLFFDDAAVHTDSVRREALKQALLDAAQRHQIFLFTCHPELWNDLGVEQRALEELKAAA